MIGLFLLLGSSSLLVSDHPLVDRLLTLFLSLEFLFLGSLLLLLSFRFLLLSSL